VGIGTVAAVRVLEIVRSLAAMVAAAAAAWCGIALLRVSPVKLARQAAAAYGGAPSLAFSACILTGFLLMPWPDGRGFPFFKTVELTVTDLARSVGRVARDPRSFRSNLSVPLAGEESVGGPALQAVGMLRAKNVDRYQLSSGIAANDWVYEQIVASGWPRRREPDAHVRVIWNSEPTAGCELMSRDRDVSLVYCP
jgi:hypothetical protein